MDREFALKMFKLGYRYARKGKLYKELDRVSESTAEDRFNRYWEEEIVPARESESDD